MLGDTRAAILAYVREHEGARPKEIAEGTGLEYSTVRQTARRMADDGQLDTDGRGRYLTVTAVTLLGQKADRCVSTAVTDATDPDGLE